MGQDLNETQEKQLIHLMQGIQGIDAVYMIMMRSPKDSEFGIQFALDIGDRSTTEPQPELRALFMTIYRNISQVIGKHRLRGVVVAAAKNLAAWIGEEDALHYRELCHRLC